MEITLETVKESMRQISAEQYGRDLDLFLSDSWHFHRILRNGGHLVVIGDTAFAVDVPKISLSPIPQEFPWRRRI
jgi:hypothetical protein